MEVHCDGGNYVLAVWLAQYLRQWGPEGEETAQRVGKDALEDAMTVVTSQPVPCAQGGCLGIVYQSVQAVGEVLMGLRK